MAVSIIERLEPIDIDHDEAKARSIPFSAIVFPSQRVVEGSPVRQTRKPILTRQRLQAPIGFRELIFNGFSSRNVSDSPHNAGDQASLRILERSI